MSGGAIFGAVSAGLFAYAFTVGIAARVLRRYDWFHVGQGEFSGWRTACPSVRPSDCGYMVGPCDCKEWWGWAVIWPLVAVSVALAFVAVDIVASTLRNIASAGFDLGRQKHDATPTDSGS